MDALLQGMSLAPKLVLGLCINLDQYTVQPQLSKLVGTRQKRSDNRGFG